MSTAKHTPGMEWKLHVPNIIKEVLNNEGAQVLTIPLRLLQRLLGQVAQRCAEVNDKELNHLMLLMALYSQGDPEDKENYNPDALINTPGINAAAPALLDALKDLADEYEWQRSNMNRDPLNSKAYIAARDAISAAAGGEEGE